MKRNIKNVKNLSLFMLVGIALLLAFAIANQQKSQPPSPSPAPETLTDEEFILNPPDESSPELLKKHAQMVKQLATEGATVELTQSCKPNPLVLKIKYGSKIEIKNLDKYDRRVIIDSKNFFDIPKGGSKKIKAQFKYGTGDYGYVCEEEGKAKIVGFLHVIP